MVHGSDLFCRGGDHQGPQPSAANSTGFLRIKRTDATEEVASAAWAETEAMESMSSDDDEDCCSSHCSSAICRRSSPCQSE